MYLKCTLIFGNTRFDPSFKGMSARSRKTNNNSVKYAKLHSTHKLVKLNYILTVSTYHLISSFMSLDKLPIKMPLQHSDNSLDLGLCPSLIFQCICSCLELIYMLCFKADYITCERLVSHTRKPSNVFIFFCALYSACLSKK